MSVRMTTEERLDELERRGELVPPADLLSHSGRSWIAQGRSSSSWLTVIMSPMNSSLDQTSLTS